jgi:hypothetical protein
LWKEDIQEHRVAIVLAGRDVIVDANAIGTYLMGSDDWSLETESWENGVWKGNRLDILWLQELNHGEVFSRRRERKRLVDIVRRFVAEE